MVPPMRQLLIAVTCLGAVAHAEPLFDAIKAQSDEAAAASKAGKYEEASAALSKWIKGPGKKLAEAEKASASALDGLSKLAEAYAARAELAKKAPKEAKAARALLLELLTPKSRAEAALVSDPRVEALLNTLRKLDPKAKAFFTPRKVKVVITGGLEGAQADELAVALVEQLRPLGFEASNVEGTETLSLETGMGKEIALSEAGGMFAKTAQNVITCELIVHAKWTAADAEVLRTDLGTRAGGFSDIPNSCVKAAIKSVASKAGGRVVEAWNAQ